jgi:diguanylate cyclase (GGDEF)-like protein
MSEPEPSGERDRLWLNRTPDGGVPSEGSTAGTPRRLRDTGRTRSDPVRRILSRVYPGLAALRAENVGLRDDLRRAEHLAVTDSLTGLANRRGWDIQLGRELSRARRLDRPLCLALIDIDHFKAFNDSHGHLAADRLLVEIAATWRSAIRDIDVLCRWGGDEFGLLLPDCPLSSAREILDRLRSTMPAGQTATAAAACWDGHEDSWSAPTALCTWQKSLSWCRVTPDVRS